MNGKFIKIDSMYCNDIKQYDTIRQALEDIEHNGYDRNIETGFFIKKLPPTPS